MKIEGSGKSVKTTKMASVKTRGKWLKCDNCLEMVKLNLFVKIMGKLKMVKWIGKI